MGVDLVSACIFCAAMLFATDLPPRDGLAAQIGFSYATLARRYEVSAERADGSDVTPKFILIGMGNARQAPDELGAGTPEMEWRARIAFAPSHDEQIRKATDELELVTATGTGRYENFALLGRIPVTAKGSAELGLVRRSENATDLLNIGGEAHALSEARTLSAGRIDAAAGWRQRWRNFEAAAAFRWTKATGYNATELSFQNASGVLLGGDAEARWRSGPWTVALEGEIMGGSLDVHRESYPAFEDRDSSIGSTLEAARLGVGYSWPKTSLFLWTSYDRQKLPFVSLAVLGTETVAFDDGYDPSSDVKQVYWDLAFGWKVSPAVRVRATVRLGWGDETVVLTDFTGERPPITLDVLRRGIFGGGIGTAIGAPEVSFFLGADFSIGAPR
jgi:hypothetical protein